MVPIPNRNGQTTPTIATDNAAIPTLAISRTFFFSRFEPHQKKVEQSRQFVRAGQRTDIRKQLPGRLDCSKPQPPFGYVQLRGAKWLAASPRLTLCVECGLNQRQNRSTFAQNRDSRSMEIVSQIRHEHPH